MTSGPHGSRSSPGWLRELARAAGWHRRLLSAGLLAGSVALGLHAVQPAPPDTAPVLVAVTELPAGQRLDADDVAVVRRDPASLPHGALASAAGAVGATLVSAVRRGEMLTDVRLLTSVATRVLPAGLVATPVRISDAEAVSLLRPGSTVDVLAAGGEQPGVPARLVASRARVLTVPRAGSHRSGLATSEGALVVLVTTEQTAARLAGAAVAERLSVVVHGE